ncbi:MAG: hypothetical protein BWY68_00772 [bacterium ADurb.Bin400]|nr:MAG: hypothetical protein BWY68_00772 [bacterium ADurb.Bin400]
MLIAAHSISGGVLGELVGNPVAAFIGAFLLHFVLDWLPHYDTTDDGVFTLRQIAFIIFDAIIAALIILFVIGFSFTTHQLFFWGALGGIFPDIIENLLIRNDEPIYGNLGLSFHRFHVSVHLAQPGAIAGIGMQLIVVVISLFAYYSIAK